MLGVEREKVFRDPVHGDIRVGPIQRTVIDSDAFQRLRYIRQNGLLHYIFPGAVHTRFAHSIGTMHVARRVFIQLFPQYAHRNAPSKDARASDYVGLVFEVAALCHDIGHCAFSHSIESLSTQRGPRQLFESFTAYVENWGQEVPEMKAWWGRVSSDAISHVEAQIKTGKPNANWIESIQHEELGILLVIALLYGEEQKQVRVAIGEFFEGEVTYDAFVQDVVALMRGEPWLPHSSNFLHFLGDLLKSIPDPSDPDGVSVNSEIACAQLAEILHDLVSGTLDVDRFDYLLRDSQHTGTVCGVFDLELLISSLALRYFGRKSDLKLCVYERAEGAIEDFLWSRYQLYQQIISHKANVMLNALFPKALAPLIGTEVRIASDYFEVLNLTDDEVMSSVRRSLLGKPEKGTPRDAAVRSAFLRKKLPRYLSRVPLTVGASSKDEAARIEQIKAEVAKEFRLSPEKIAHAVTSTEMIKGGNLPKIIRKVHLPNNKVRESVEDTIIVGGKSPAAVRTAHFFFEQVT